MKILDFLVKFLEHFSFDREIRVTRYCLKSTLDPGSNAWQESFDWKRNDPKMALLSRKSKIFIKAKVIFMKSYFLRQVGFMIWCIFNDFIFKTRFTKRAKLLQKNAWPRHYPKRSTVSKIALYFLEELFMMFFDFKWIVRGPGFKSQRSQTLEIDNFEALEVTAMYFTFSETSHLPLFG